MKAVTVLMYHALEDSEHPAKTDDPGEQLYVLNTETFKHQMEYLWRQGFSTILLNEFSSNAQLQERTVILSFDDGHQSNYTLALPILRQFSYRADFFVTTNRIGTENHLTPDQILALHEAGMGIGSHGVSHRFFDQMDELAALKELRDSRQVLGSITGHNPTAFSAPGGRLHKNMEQLAQQAGYSKLCTSKPGYCSNNTPHFNIPRFAIRHTTTETDFREILEQNQMHLLRQSARSSILSLAKQMIGTRLYEALRQQMLKDLKSNPGMHSDGARRRNHTGEAAP